VNIPKLFVDSECIDCGSNFFISTFLSSVPPTYLWIRHAFWDLPCLKSFHQEIFPRNFGQNFPVGFQDVGSKFSRRFSGRNILKKLCYLLGGHYIYFFYLLNIFMYCVRTFGFRSYLYALHIQVYTSGTKNNYKGLKANPSISWENSV